ncbi:putative beta-defensin 109B [Ursus maritimus]|uniref:Beta-defensin 109B n=2 Tax=Ursidae TaxID=9632 RepID=A0A8M1GTR9_URSMA|nr:putative beta-defensin 109B [Ursus maritimus]XP_048082234.1 beta-defensin 109 [Ursus arctos]
MNHTKISYMSKLRDEVRSGLASGENRCLNLSGICRRDICKLTEDQIGACRRRWRCCRSWWILIPIPTPLVYSDYQEPLKHKLK